MHALYDLAVGPLAWLAFAVFILGSIYRLMSMRALALKKDAAFVAYISWPHAIRSLLHWVTPFGALGWRENPGVTIVTFLFHICLFVVPLFLMGHIVVFDTFHGWSWPALPDGVADTLSIVVVAACAYFLWRRLTVPEVRFVTRSHDWLVLALVGGLGWLGYAWSQTQYFVIGRDGYVVIYQGIPQAIGPWSFSHPVEVTDVALSRLTQVDRDRLQEPVVRSSREEIDAYVARLESGEETTATPTPTPSPSPGTSGPVSTASPSPTPGTSH